MAVSAFLVANLLMFHGIPVNDVKMLTCIAEKESNFNPTAINKKNRNKTHDHGLFQINDVNKKMCNTTSKQLLNISNNVQCAVKVYKTQNLKAWSTYDLCKKELKNERRNDNGGFRVWISFHSPHA